VRVGWWQQREADGLAIQDSYEVPEIHPSQVRVGDIIGTLGSINSRYTVKMISDPRTTPRRWTFFGRDDKGLQHTNTFGEDELVRRFAKAS